MNFIRADLTQANLAGADLCWASLNEAKLPETDLTGGILAGTKLSSVILSAATLCSANLHRTNLVGADLSKVDLTLANLSESRIEGKLSGAILNQAKLINASLDQASFIKAIFRATDIFRSNLSGANLTGALFEWANLNWIDCTETDFNQTKIMGTPFGHIDLSVTKRLETVEHFGPSFIDVHTLQLSKGRSPEVFLRGAGVSDTFITYAASLTGEAIQYYTCFISYSHQDQSFVDRFYTDLQAKGVRCWYAAEDLKIGDKIRPTIDQSIRLHDKLLIILSKNSLNSFWVESEV